jgi:hypothetical protein
MYRAELKGRVFRIGMFAAVLVVLAGLGACNTALAPDDPGEQAAPLGVLDASGRVAVRVGIPALPGRSVTNDMVPVYANWYEVVFKKHGATTDQNDYYSASAEAGKEYLSISVPPGKYDILLLAGAKANRVLLATGFVDADDNTGTGTGAGYTIAADKPNVIKPGMHKINLTPDGDAAADITFTHNTGPITYARNVETNIGTVPVPSTATSFTVHLAFKLEEASKFIDLINAAGGAETTTPPFNSNKAQLSARYNEEAGLIKVTSVPGLMKKADGIEAAAKLGEVAQFIYEFDPLSSIIKAGTNNIDGVVRLELRYYAFGFEKSGSSLWNIRNGLDYDLDNGNSGGSLVVKVGTGSVLLETPTIDFEVPGI